MKVVVVDNDLKSKLLAARDDVEIRDANGRRLGHFFAHPQPVAEVRNEAGEVLKRYPEPNGITIVVEGDWPSDEEIERRLRDEARFTPEQVMERLRSLRESK
jgi:hypothetical protein